jgi:hypothetical protein
MSNVAPSQPTLPVPVTEAIPMDASEIPPESPRTASAPPSDSAAPSQPLAHGPAPVEPVVETMQQGEDTMYIRVQHHPRSGVTPHTRLTDDSVCIKAANAAIARSARPTLDYA